MTAVGRLHRPLAAIRMEQTIEEIMNEYGESISEAEEIVGLGSVNKIYGVKGSRGHYIVRLNKEGSKRLEYRKEQWCIEKVSCLGIPSPEILKLGYTDNFSYMIQAKVAGENGKNCTEIEKRNIWKILGQYAKKFHKIETVENKLVREQLFHRSWKSRLRYNLNELNKEDSLSENRILTYDEKIESKV